MMWSSGWATRFNSRSRGGSDAAPRRLEEDNVRFNSRSRGGSDARCLCRRRTPAPRFNSRSRGGSDPKTQMAAVIGEVSIHAPAGGATATMPNACGITPSFNSRSRGGSDFKKVSLFPSMSRFQFTLPRGERQNAQRRHRYADHVSIHAPAGGATLPRFMGDGGSSVSIHAPAGGATPSLIPLPPINHHVSIHAPAGGATDRLSSACAESNRFNSRSRGGSDTVSRSRKLVRCGFQFTLPRGERPPRRPPPARPKKGFNSRSRGGSDAPSPTLSSDRPTSFNSRSRGGSDVAAQLGGLGVHGVSIHAPAGGATLTQERRHATPARFNSRSRGGSDSATPPSP